jgi:hypothetical protein
LYSKFSVGIDSKKVLYAAGGSFVILAVETVKQDVEVVTARQASTRMTESTQEYFSSTMKHSNNG